MVVGVGLVVSIGLNYLDKKFGFTDKLVEYIESAQQEFVEKARELEADIWDIGAMYADNVLHKGKEIIEYEVRKYIRHKYFRAGKGGLVMNWINIKIRLKSLLSIPFFLVLPLVIFSLSVEECIFIT
ncbi:hypothetical protein [Yersinia kristensenii]|uniref:hypothetical protein n=1 Tax=Yersinia kristensenii TaxID=28152 RepID=UPI000E0479A3|nr:hypothetical protein [Yersinia kristensenii]SUP67005.1 Uncharacterised protein [Yersinia kristensenii]